MKKINKYWKFGFTLVETIVSVTIFAIIMVIAVDSLWNIWILRTKVSDRTDLNKDLYYSVETLVSAIKDFGWQIDYEEYWNRQAMWIATQSWHYQQFSWFWNFWSWWDLTGSWYWDWFYFCRSGSWTSMWTWWCLINWFNTYSGSVAWQPQRYWEYSFQFIDYNSNQNYDTWWLLWDENWDWNIRWDDDDENLWIWPLAFSWNEVKELYLINKWQKYTRLFLRVNYKIDPNSPALSPCTDDWSWNVSGSWCLWNIEILKLDWKDLWFSHSWGVATSSWIYDWLVDTWQCSGDFSCDWVNNLPSATGSEWVSLFPDYINVKSAKFFIYPNKDYNLSWRDGNSYSVNPYVRLNITLWYAWIKRAAFKNGDPSINISTTINLNKTN